MKSVLIIGSGLLGLSLAEKFSKNGCHVYVTTTTKSKLPQLQNQGYKSLIFDSNELKHYEQFSSLKIDTLVFALAPSKCKIIGYTEVLSNICNNLHSFNLMVFTSSISVYSNNQKFHTEKSEAVEISSTIFQTESYIKQHVKQYYIFRLAGLIDKQRHPKNFHKGLDVKQANAPVNLVHIQDVSTIIYASITKNIDFGSYNVCSPEHPTKKEYYGSFNELLNFTEGIIGKKVNGSMILKHINYNNTSIYDFTGTV